MSPLRNNPKNDRAKRDYLIYLKEARQRSAATVEQARHAIDRLETYSGFQDFATFNKDQGLGFKRALLASKAQRTGKPISKATAHHALQSIKEFSRLVAKPAGLPPPHRPGAYGVPEPDDQGRAHRARHIAESLCLARTIPGRAVCDAGRDRYRAPRPRSDGVAVADR